MDPGRGRRDRKTRDYGEIGLTRTYQPAGRVWVEVSARMHRIDADYEYSYRVLAITRFDVPIKRRP